MLLKHLKKSLWLCNVNDSPDADWDVTCNQPSPPYGTATPLNFQPTHFKARISLKQSPPPPLKGSPSLNLDPPKMIMIGSEKNKQSLRCVVFTVHAVWISKTFRYSPRPKYTVTIHICRTTKYWISADGTGVYRVSDHLKLYEMFSEK